jgi:chromosome segregation ATPase
MGIDWEKAEKDPGSKQKIQNSFLLDIKKKINDLERRVLELRKTIEFQEGEIIEDKIKLANAGSFIKELMEELSEKNESFDILEKEKGNIQNQLIDLKQKFESLKKKNRQLIGLKNKIREKDIRLAEYQDQIQEYRNNSDLQKEQIEEKGLIIENKEEKIKQFQGEIEQIKHERLEFENTLRSREREITQLKKELQNTNERVSIWSGNQKLLNKIENVMELKGFLSEKELESLKRGKKI